MPKHVGIFMCVNSVVLRSAFCGENILSKTVKAVSTDRIAIPVKQTSSRQHKMRYITTQMFTNCHNIEI